MKPEEPQFLKEWWGKQREPIPRCCHTCDHYEQDGRCAAYDMEPPAEFTQQRDACPQWIEMIPF